MSEWEIEQYIQGLLNEQLESLEEQYLSSLVYRDAEKRGELAYKLFSDVLSFDDVHVVTDG